MSVFTKVLKAGEGKKVRRLAELVPLINDLEPEMQGLTDDALVHRTVEFKERLDNGETLDDLLVEAYATVREAAWRVLGQQVPSPGGRSGGATGRGRQALGTIPPGLRAGLWLKVEASRRRNDPRKATCGR